MMLLLSVPIKNNYLVNILLCLALLILEIPICMMITGIKSFLKRSGEENE